MGDDVQENTHTHTHFQTNTYKVSHMMRDALINREQAMTHFIYLSMHSTHYNGYTGVGNRLVLRMFC